MCLQSIYDENRESGLSPEKSAEPILDVLTNGLWAAWEKDKINSRINEIIKAFEKPNVKTNEK